MASPAYGLRITELTETLKSPGATGAGKKGAHIYLCLSVSVSVSVAVAVAVVSVWLCLCVHACV